MMEPVAPEGFQIVYELDGTPMQDGTGENIFVQKIGDDELILMPMQKHMNNYNHIEVEDDSTCSQDQSVNNWSNEATKYFLALWSKHKEKFRDPHLKKKKVFALVSEEMKEKNYNFSEADIERKYRNMKQYYLNIKDHNSKTGRSRKSWTFFDQINEILTDDKSINPSSVTGSMMNSADPPTGFGIIQQCFPNTNMLAENSSNSDVIAAVKKRRLAKPVNENEHVKKVRRSKNPASMEIIELEQSRNDEIRQIRESIDKQNNIQENRNKLIEKLLEKF